MSIVEQINKKNENTWLRIGRVAESVNEEADTLFSYENVLKHNHFNINALKKIADLYKKKGEYTKAIEYYNRILNVENNNSEIWSDLGHCFLLRDQLQKSYSAYRQSLYKAKLQNKTKHDSNTWYGIGVLYERFGYLDNAEECLRSIFQSNQNYERNSEIFFRLGMIYKMKKKYEFCLQSFEYIKNSPPPPLTTADIYYQIGHIYEVMKDFKKAKEYYEISLKFDPKHSSVLQQLGWLYFRDDVKEFGDLEVAVEYFQKSIESCSENGLTWYLLGRSFMKQKEYKKAFDAYQQSVFRDGRNPLFWCSIGILYFQINQQQDALDAYSKAIKLNDRISEVWYNLGTLYESCNQLDDALDAYKKAAELNPNDQNIKKKLIFHNIQLSLPPKQMVGPQLSNVYQTKYSPFQKKVVPPLFPLIGPSSTGIPTNYRTMPTNFQQQKQSNLRSKQTNLRINQSNLRTNQSNVTHLKRVRESQNQLVLQPQVKKRKLGNTHQSISSNTRSQITHQQIPQQINSNINFKKQLQMQVQSQMQVQLPPPRATRQIVDNNKKKNEVFEIIELDKGEKNESSKANEKEKVITNENPPVTEKK